jgi:hypothetical protein
VARGRSPGPPKVASSDGGLYLVSADGVLLAGCDGLVFQGHRGNDVAELTVHDLRGLALDGLHERRVWHEGVQEGAVQSGGDLRQLGDGDPTVTLGMLQARASSADGGLPVTLRAVPLGPSVPRSDGPRYLAPGTDVPGRDVQAHARASGPVSYGLANVGGAKWPAITVDGGRQWRIDGPLFSYAAMQAASTVSAVGTLGADGAYAWGLGGNFVRLTIDRGVHWSETDFTGGLETFVYVSSDQGRTWTRGGQLARVTY